MLIRTEGRNDTGERHIAVASRSTAQVAFANVVPQRSILINVWSPPSCPRSYRPTPPPPVTLADFRYFYDINNNRLFQAKQHYIGQGQAYTYDEVDRLIRFDEGHLVGGVIPNPIDTEVYGLDDVGIRKAHEKNGQLFTNSVDSMNRYAASYNEGSTSGLEAQSAVAEGEVVAVLFPPDSVDVVWNLVER